MTYIESDMTGFNINYFKIRLKVSLLVIVTLLSFSLSAQDGKEEADNDSITQNDFNFSLTMSNNQISRGRKLANNTLNIIPKFHYCYREGLYADVFFTYFPSLVVKQLDNFGAGIGYNLNFTENISSDFEYVYTNYETYREVNSSASHALNWTLEWENPYLTPSLELSYLAGKTQDIAATINLTHSFAFEHIFTSKDKLSLPLSVSGTFGTSNFYQAYINNNVIITKKKKAIKPEVIDPAFDITDIDITLSASYEIGQFSINPEMSYEIPFNHISYLNSSGLPILTIELVYSF